MHEIFVNGERQHIPAPLSLAELLAQLEVSSDRVAIELNREIIRKRDWPNTLVSPGAQIEIVQFVGGG